MKLPVKQLSVAIVDDVFHQCLADTLGHAAVHLALDDHGIDDHATIVRAVKRAQLTAPVSGSTMTTARCIACGSLVSGGS